MKIIVGIDPGVTVGIAVLNADSVTRKIETFSSRNFPYSDVIKWISQQGEPVIVATDKAKPPAVVRKIAATFGARLFYPQQDMRQKDKSKLTSGIATKSDHEADALAAALYSKIYFQDTLEKVEKSVAREIQGVVKKMLLTNQVPNIETAVEMLNFRRNDVRGRERIRTRSIRETMLESELEEARIRNARLEKEISELRSELEKKHYPRNETMAMKKLRESSMKILLEKDRLVKEMEKIISGEYILAEPYRGDGDFRNKAVILDTDIDIRKIENSGALAIITDLDIESSLPIVQKRKANIKQVGKFLVVERSLLASHRSENFVEWLNAYRENRKEKNRFE